MTLVVTTPAPGYQRKRWTILKIGNLIAEIRDENQFGLHSFFISRKINGN